MSDAPTPPTEDTAPTEDTGAPGADADGGTASPGHPAAPPHARTGVTEADRPLLAKNLARCGERREADESENWDRHLADLKALADSLGGELLVTRHQHDVLGQVPRTGRTPNHAHPERRDVKFVPDGTPVGIYVDLAGLDPAVFARLLYEGAFKARS